MEYYKKVAGLEVTGETPGVLTFLGDSEEATRIEIIRGAGSAFQGTGISVGFAHPDPVAYREELSAAGYDVPDISVPTRGPFSSTSRIPTD